MPNLDLVHQIKPKQAIVPAAHTASTNGADIDTAGFDGCDFFWEIGAWTDGTHTPKLQSAPDSSGSPGTYADCAASELSGNGFAAVSGSGGASTVQECGYIGINRWARIVITRSGTTTGVVDGATAVLGRAIHQPV